MTGGNYELGSSAPVQGLSLWPWRNQTQ